VARQISIPDPSAVLISRAGQYKRALWVAGPPGREKPLTTLSYTGPKEPERYSTNSKNFHHPPRFSNPLHMTPLPTNTSLREQLSYITLCLSETLQIISEKFFQKKISEKH
jgi:hypothetical protein